MEEEKKKSKRKWLLWLWLIFLSPVVGIVAMFSLVSMEVFGPLPTFEELENPKSNLASEVYTADQEILGKYYRENRTNIQFEDISPWVPTALVSTEDERYFGHTGIDFWALPRVFGGVLMGTTSKGGGSTITQQLAKMLFHERPSSKIGRIIQKFQEWVIAVRLERHYTKEEIIAMYLNRFDFIHTAVGIKSASQVYFNTTVDQLDILQSATLVGMAKNPVLYDPLRKPENSLKRRNIVLGQMLRNEKITREEFDSLKALPIELDFQSVDHKSGIAPYFREILRRELGRLFNEKDPETDEYVLSKPDGSGYDIYRDGLRVYTTLDSRMQRYAEKAVESHLSNLQVDFWREINRNLSPPFHNTVTKKEVERIIQSAIRRTPKYAVLTGKECANCGRRSNFVSTIERNDSTIFVCSASDCLHEEPAPHPDSILPQFYRPEKMKIFTWKGEVDTTMSYVDFIKYNKSILQSGMMSMDPHTGFVKAWVGGIDYKHFVYDHVKQGKRQVGSTFKPFVFGLAMQEGMSPCKKVPNTLYTFYKGEYGLLDDWTPKNSEGTYGYDVSLKYALANSMNTITAWLFKQFSPQAIINFAKRLGIESEIDPVPSLCLGIADVSVYEMVGAYSTFANKGVWTEPIFISRIEDKNGNVIHEVVPETREAMSEEQAYVMLDLLKGIVDGVRGDHDGRVIGTGVRLRGQPSDARPYQGIYTKVAGKTGTTQNNSDGWFIGITPDLVTGVWVGAEDRGVHFSRTYYGQGANMALPVWAYYMKDVYADKSITISTEDFEAPENGVSVELDCSRYKETISTFQDDEFNQ